MNTIQVLSCSILLLAQTPDQATAHDGLSGKWVGFMPMNRLSRLVEVSFEQRTGTWRGKVDIRTMGPTSLLDHPFETVHLEGDQVRFTLKTQNWGDHAFEGTLANGLILGKVKHDEGSSAFHLVAIAELPLEEYESYTGWYEYDADRPRWITLDPYGGLNYMNLDGMTSTALLPASKDRFFAYSGRAQITTYVTFERGAKGQVESMTWRQGENEPLVARRIPDRIFSQQEVRFNNGDIQLGGRLLLPLEGGPHPASEAP